MGLDGSFLSPRHDCEWRYQSLAVSCVFRKDCPTTLLLKYLLILSSLGLSTTFLRPLMKAEGSVCRMCAGDADERRSLQLISLNLWFSKSQKTYLHYKRKTFPKLTAGTLNVRHSVPSLTGKAAPSAWSSPEEMALSSLLLSACNTLVSCVLPLPRVVVLPARVRGRRWLDQLKQQMVEGSACNPQLNREFCQHQIVLKSNQKNTGCFWGSFFFFFFSVFCCLLCCRFTGYEVRSNMEKLQYCYWRGFSGYSVGITGGFCAWLVRSP